MNMEQILMLEHPTVLEEKLKLCAFDFILS